MFGLSLAAGGGWLIAKIIHYFARMGGNRNYGVVGFSAFLSALLVVGPVAVYFFTGLPPDYWDSWRGWMMGGGVVIVGLLLLAAAPGMAANNLEEDKYCEEKGVYLVKKRTGKFDLAGLPVFLEGLKTGDFNKLAELPPLTPEKESYFQVSLFLLPEANRFAVGYLEAAIGVTVKYGEKEKGLNRTSDNWRFLSLAWNSHDLVKIGRQLKLV